MLIVVGLLVVVVFWTLASIAIWQSYKIRQREQEALKRLEESERKRRTK
jgi:hypothetical protein